MMRVRFHHNGRERLYTIDLAGNAIRLEMAGWSTADTWLRMQSRYDLWQAKQRAGSIQVKPFATLPLPAVG